MNQDPVFPPGYLEALARDCFDTSYAATHHPAALVLQSVGSLAAFTGALTVHLAWYGGKSILARLRRHVSPPEPLPPSAPRQPPSLRGLPTPEDIEEAWDLDPRTLCGRLRIGSRLADLEPTLDSRFVFRKTRNGSKRICARRPGLKGWMRKNVPAVKYPTAMHYKKLATRLRQLIGLDARIPLEWLLPDNEEDLSALSPADRKAADAAKARLGRLLVENPKLTHLAQTVESKLGIMRMVTIRRIQPPKRGRGRLRKSKENAMNPLVSQLIRAGVVVRADEGRTRAFWDAIRKVLGEPEPDAETRRLQSDIRAWLNAPLEARQNRVR